jgi:hypothetical protein
MRGATPPLLNTTPWRGAQLNGDGFVLLQQKSFVRETADLVHCCSKAGSIICALSFL